MSHDRILSAARLGRLLTLPLCVAVGLGCYSEQGWDYRPTDRPLGWSGDDLIFFRSHTWGAYDMFTSTCEGSGIFRLEPDGAVSPVRTDERVCEAEGPHRLSPDGSSVLAAHHDFEDSTVYSILLLPLDSDSALVTRPDSSARWIGDPVWIGSAGRWAFVSESPSVREVRVSIAGETASRPLFPIESDLRLEAWDSTKQAFRLLRPLWDSTPGAVFEMDTLGAILSERIVTESEYPSPSGDRVATIEVRNTFGWRKTTSDFALIIRDRVRGTETEVFATDPDAGTVDTGFGHVREGMPGRSVVWERDGQGIVFMRYYRNGATLWRVGVDGTGLRQLTQHDLTAEPEMPSW